MTKFTTVIFFLSIVLLSSCVSNRKLRSLNQTIQGQKQTEAKLDSLLTNLNQFRNEKNELGELDDTSSIAIQKILITETENTKNRIDSLNKIQDRVIKKRVKGKEYKNMITLITSGSMIRSEKMEIVDFVDQLLKQQTFIKFNTAAFFPPGGYIIDSSKLEDAKTSFAPLIDSLLKFVNKFPTFDLTSAVISCGYADGLGFAPGPLVDTLTYNIGKPDPSQKELNLELSRLRAEEISGILLEIFKEKIQNQPFSKNLNTRFFKTGKGEELPNKKIKDYQVDDDRRRIVVIYWNALPEVKE